MEQWIKKMNEATFHLDEKNPHEKHPYLKEYLSYYMFDMTEFDQYRCGTMMSHNQNIFIQAFLKEKSKGMVLFVHGYLDHSGGLSRTVNELLANGYDVVTLDLPGHGFSQGESGTVATFDKYVDAVEIGYQFICDMFMPTKLFGVGHSTGGAILFHAVSEEKVELKRLVLVAPLYFPFRWNLVKGAIRMVGKVIPKQKRRFKKNSHDQAYQKFIKQDPLQVKWLKTDWLRAMEEWHKHIIYCSTLKTPVYFIQGGKDTTVDYKKNVLFYKQKCHHLQIAFFPAGRHQLLNEHDEIRHLVYERMTSFLDKT
ncbi:alpha/beta fold hydrolase [Salipaludibacillus daqingensis]|uniref:alpha/beta fold hydrolase n=1 Tax=Salipaludibacillus daqingensis TaxID=3041001 RepID=UPI002473524F|nr:alpha/beta fold hydrolase [Salipaludibacillus daqingensis]